MDNWMKCQPVSEMWTKCVFMHCVN